MEYATKKLSESIIVLPNYADDTAAAAGGIAIGQLYRNGSVVMIRVV